MIVPDNPRPPAPEYVPPYYPRPKNWTAICIATITVLVVAALVLMVWLTPNPA